MWATKRPWVVLLCGASLFAYGGVNCAHAVPYEILHHFQGTPDDGRSPTRSLVVSDSKLYGMTLYGGDDNVGTVFRMNMDGSGFTLLHEFAGGATDGQWPQGSLTVSDSKLYAMTHWGGATNLGTVFSMNMDGSGYNLLREFAGGADDGKWPFYGSLVVSGSTLYGMTCYGGNPDVGTVFSMDVDGSDFLLLHDFAGGATDGQNPWGSLTVSDSKLYGMTNGGGDADFGTVFSMNMDGSDFVLLREFAGAGDDGRYPFGSLIVSDSKLYGMTNWGGDDERGTVFSMNMDGSGFTLLHEFAGGGDDGAHPWGSLTVLDSKLYGTTCYGGDDNLGTVFRMDMDGSGFNLLHEFGGSPADGRLPYGSLTLSGWTLYGMTEYGGSEDMGTVFAIVIPEPATVLLFGTGLLGVVGYLSRRRVRK